jgi:hypothetical protein
LKGRKINLTENIIKAHNDKKKSVLQLDENGDMLKRFDCCTEAGEYIGTSKNNINMCCNGHRKTTKGYVWKYEKDYEKKIKDKDENKVKNDNKIIKKVVEKKVVKEIINKKKDTNNKKITNNK